MTIFQPFTGSLMKGFASKLHKYLEEVFRTNRALFCLVAQFACDFSVLC